MKSLHILLIILAGFGITTAQAKSPYEAAITGDLEALRQYRFEGGDLYIPDQRGFTPYELTALHADPDKEDVLQRHVEIMLWLKEYNPKKHTYGKASTAFVQASLNALGYPVGKPDGVLGEKSSEAIRSYQRDNELAETGRLGPQWLGMLYQDSLKDLQFKLSKLGYETYGTDGRMGPNTRNAMLKYRNDNALTTPDYPYLDSLLLSSIDNAFNKKEKHRKDAIAKKAHLESLRQTRYAQSGLRAKGYRIGKVDGMQGSKTANAIKAFQQKHKLVSNGELDNKTLSVMNEVFTKDTQRKLNALGYAVGKPDGSLGKRTRDAIKKYRKSHGLSVSSSVDSDLLSSLHRNHLALEDKRKAKNTAVRNEKNSGRVQFAQAGLRSLGHPVSIDGVMGKTTAKYIKKFQKRYRLKLTSQVDNATFAKMKTIFLKETQRKLNALGYLTGTPDGQLGKRSQVAIKKYRQQVNLSGSGVTATLIASVDDSYDNRGKKKTVTAKIRQPKKTYEVTKTKKLTKPSKELPIAVTIKVPEKPQSTAKVVTPVNKSRSNKVVATATTKKSGRFAKGRMSFNRSGGRVVGCSLAGRNIPIEWCEPFYPLPRKNHCEATFKPSNGAVLNLWCK